MFTGPITLAPKVLQFADDTVIIAEAYPKNLQIIALILGHFASISGLQINNQKLVFVPISIHPNGVQILKSILNCPISDFPITYLGLPLSIRKPRRIHFMPLIEAMQARTQGWQSKFLSLAGRLTLVKAVLSSMPLHFLQSLKLPNWVYNEMDKIRRNFLWKGSDKCSGSHCLVRWEICTLPKKNGGLGIVHLPTQNDALLLRWLWKLSAETDSIWTKTITQIYGTNDIARLSTSSRLSHTMKSLLQLTPLLNASTQNVGMSPQVTWRWTSNKLYTAKSTYNAMRHPGCISPFHEHLWKLKAPPKVKLFMWLSLLNRLLTKDNLLKKGWPMPSSCTLCNSGVEETISHMFIQCHFSKQVYNLVNNTITTLGHSSNIQEHWQKIRSLQSQTLESAWLATVWNLWKERNLAIFENAVPSTRRVSSKAILDASLWVANC